MNLHRIFEIFLYELVDLIPHMVLALLPFENNLRCSKRITGILIVILYLLLCTSRLLALGSLPAAACLTVLWIIIYLGFYRFSIQAELPKLLFVLLTVLNYGSFNAIIFSHLAYHRFQDLTVGPYSFVSTLFLLFVMALTYPIIYLFMTHKIKPLFSGNETNRIWHYLWMIPATFCLSYYYNLYSNGGIITYSFRTANVLFAAFFNAGALFTTYIMVKLLEESNASLHLKAENYQLNMQFVQYENMKNRIEEARRARHDLRQSIAVIQHYLQKDDKKGLQNYLSQYIASLPSASPILYCDDFVVNALIVYYETLSQKHHISFHAEADYPSDCGIMSTDMVVLLGNLLENALEANLKEKDGNGFISLLIKYVAKAVVITVDNTHHQSIRKSGDTFLSSKNGRAGIGLSSVQKISEKYQGIAKFEYSDREFHASVFLYPIIQ